MKQKLKRPNNCSFCNLKTDEFIVARKGGCVICWECVQNVYELMSQAMEIKKQLEYKF